MKTLKFILLISGLMMAFNSYAAKCSKAEAINAVKLACKDIEAKGKAALPIIKKRKHCVNNYVWIQSKDVKMVMHPIKPRLNGKSLMKNKDENGVLLFIEFEKMAAAKAEGGWVDYFWPKAGAEKATAKTSFVIRCKGALEWVAGSGVWKSDMK